MSDDWPEPPAGSDVTPLMRATIRRRHDEWLAEQARDAAREQAVASRRLRAKKVQRDEGLAARRSRRAGLDFT